MAGPSNDCVCLQLSFLCGDDSTFTIDLFQEGNIDTGGGEYPFYVGSYSSNNYIVYWNFSILGWSFEDTTNLGTPIFSAGTSVDVCNFLYWDIGDTTNFQFCTGNTPPYSANKGVQPCPNPTGDTCGNCSCWYFSGSDVYTISYYDCNNTGKSFTLPSGGTSSFCLKGTPIVVPPTVSNFYSAKTTNSCFIDCVPTGYCECINVYNDDDNLGFYVGGTINGKTFWISDSGYRIYWGNNEWNFEVGGQVSATTTGGGICPPTGSINTNFTPSIFVDNFTLETYDCYPEFNSEKKCWSITATTDDEIITFYDNLNSDPKKAILFFSGNTMEVCAYDKPVSSNLSTTIIETTGSCYTFCDSIDICGCIRLKITCQSEVSTITTNIDLVPSGKINGKPFYIYKDNIIAYFGTLWSYYNVTNAIKLANIIGKNIVCPYDEPWEILSNGVCLCLGIGSEATTFEVIPKICPQFPTPTPTPTPTPIPYVEPTCNECIPTTVFDMVVECVPTNPTSPTSADGSLSLMISGGTEPYMVTWSNDNLGPDIFNLTEGYYTATTVDYYGDFTAVTVCELIAVKPTTTTTTTTEPPITGETLCMTISTIQSTGTTNESITFIPDVVVNGKLSWVSSGGNSIIWNNTNSRWEVVFNPTRTYFVISLNPAFPPLNNWIVVGVSGLVNVVVGECPLTMMLMNSKNKSVSFRSLINKDNNFNNLFL